MKLVLIFISLALPSISFGRPEYALKTTTVNCSSCHLNPFGGGARRVFGKTYGSFGLGLAPLSKQDLFSADLRALGYFPSDKTNKVSGFSLMNVQGTLNGEITEDREDIIKTNLVVNFNSSAMNSVSETFMLFEPNDKMHIIVGRFVRPIGLLSDEHRTYVRMQTNSSLRDYNQGIGLAHQIFDNFHFDLTFTNEETAMGGQANYDKVFNFRWTPFYLPIMSGVTFGQTSVPTGTDASFSSVYAGMSLDRATDYKIPVTITGEVSQAIGWNARMNRLSNFSSDPGFVATIADRTSLGFYSQVMWNIRPSLALLYKFDQLLLDRDYPADAFDRHGLGLNWSLNSNTMLQMRYESADNGRPGLDPASKNSLNTFFFVLRAWL